MADKESQGRLHNQMENSGQGAVIPQCSKDDPDCALYVLKVLHTIKCKQELANINKTS